MAHRYLNAELVSARDGPTWERKIRVLTVWLTAALFGRDIVSLASVQHPREAFVTGGEPAPLPSARHLVAAAPRAERAPRPARQLRLSNRPAGLAVICHASVFHK